jgi:hypothetical protein
MFARCDTASMNSSYFTWHLLSDGSRRTPAPMGETVG